MFLTNPGLTWEEVPSGRQATLADDVLASFPCGMQGHVGHAHSHSLWGSGKALQTQEHTFRSGGPFSAVFPLGHNSGGHMPGWAEQ